MKIKLISSTTLLICGCLFNFQISNFSFCLFFRGIFFVKRSENENIFENRVNYEFRKSKFIVGIFLPPQSMSTEPFFLLFQRGKKAKGLKPITTTISCIWNCFPKKKRQCSTNGIIMRQKIWHTEYAKALDGEDSYLFIFFLIDEIEFHRMNVYVLRMNQFFSLQKRISNQLCYVNWVNR